MTDDDRPRALVVDDDPMIRLDACDILTDAGFSALEAATVEEAIGRLETHGHTITLLFTDVQMPGDRDGFDLAQETARRWPAIRILVASGNRAPRADDLPEGAVFISKPFSAQVVHDQLRELLPDGEKPEPLRRTAAAPGKP